MKYLAIFKDSLREARDSWVLLGLMVLASIVILFVFSLSFEPLSAERTMRLFFAPRPDVLPEMFAALNNRKGERALMIQLRWRPFELEKVEVLSGESDAPTSDYLLTVKRGAFHPRPPMFGHKGPPIEHKNKDAEQEREADLALLRTLFEDADEAGFIKLGAIEAVGDKPGANEPQQYKISVHGTSKTHRIWATETSFLFGWGSLNWILSDTPLAFRLYKVAKFFISFGSWVAVLLGIVVTAFFLPNMLRKGTIDLLLVKPISRGMLLFYKYLGGLTFMFLITAYAIGGIWFALGIRSGFWANGALLMIFTLTFFFAILYAISTLVGVVTRSVVMCILLTVVTYGILAAVGLLNDTVKKIEQVEKEFEKHKEFAGDGLFGGEEKPGWLSVGMATVKVVYAVSPRTDDLNDLNDLIVYSDFLTGSIANIPKLDSAEHNWWLSLLVATAWIAVFLGLSIAWFYFKDY
jgi:ABC-type transport system involved in multi-copper enzyme maturation permease subunit